jgi:dipeptidyl aminopeptidase/acylaminoacyl peptidase
MMPAMRKNLLGWLGSMAFVASAFAQAGPDTVSPPEALIAESVPPIDRSIANAVERYTEFRGASPLAWHPFERAMVIRTRFGEASQAHLLAGPGMSRQQITFLRDGVGSAFYPRRSADYLVVGAAVGGNEFTQLHRLDLDTRELTLLTDGKSQNGAGAWMNGKDVLAYTSTRRNGRDRDVYYIDPRDPASDRKVLDLEGGGWSISGFSHDDATLLLRKGISVAQAELWLVDADGTNLRQIAPRDGAIVSYGGGRLLKDGKTILTTSDREGEFRNLVLLDIETGAETDLTPTIDWDVGGWDITEDEQLVAFITNEAGRSVLRAIDLRTRAEVAVPSLPAGQVGGANWRPGPPDSGLSPREMAVTLNSSKAPAEIWSLDFTSGQVIRWTQAEGAVATDSFVEPRLVSWKSFDGLEITGWLYAPDPARFPGKRPVMVSIHGGPEAQSRPGFQGRNNYFLNELGVAILYPNVRGSTGFGKTFVSLDNGFKREDSVKDIGAMLDWLPTQPDLDPTRVMITGGSYGGYMTYAVAVHYSDRIRSAIASVGISNFVTFLESTEAYRRDLRRVEYGDERDPAMREHLIKISPLTNVDQINVPFMVVQGANDPRVPAGESRQIVDALRKKGIDAWYLLAMDEGHGFAKKSNSDFQFYATVEFMKRHLLDE